MKILSAAIMALLILVALLTGDPVVGALVVLGFALAIAFYTLRGFIRWVGRTAKEA